MRTCRRVGAVGLLVLCGLCLATRSAALGQQNGSGLVALFSFDEMSGRQVRDLSGNGFNGMVSGATWVEGKFGGALQFDGVDDFVQAVGYYQFSKTNALTFEAWVRLTAHEGFDTILAFRRCCDYRLMISPALHPFYDPGSYYDFEAGAYTPTLDAWHHYALVLVGGEAASLYVDGALIMTDGRGVPARLPDTYDALSIGGVADGNGLFTAGIIDEVRIYDTALTASQIRRDMTTSATEALMTDAAAALTRLESLGADTTTVKGAMRDVRVAIRRGDTAAAQEQAARAMVVARGAIRKVAGSPAGSAVDYGRVLFVALLLLSGAGALTAAGLIWGAWRGDRHAG